jgi:hypothetical protein
MNTGFIILTNELNDLASCQIGFWANIALTDIPFIRTPKKTPLKRRNKADKYRYKH